MPTPEELARVNIDKLLTGCCWVIQDTSGLNRYAALGVTVREIPLELGKRIIFFVDGKAVGVIKAKPEGTTLSGTPMTTGTTGRQKLTKSFLMAAPYALLPLEGQHRILAEVERRLSVAREVESVVEKTLVRLGRLRQAVLNHAFEGRL